MEWGVVGGIDEGIEIGVMRSLSAGERSCSELCDSNPPYVFGGEVELDFGELSPLITFVVGA